MRGGGGGPKPAPFGIFAPPHWENVGVSPPPPSPPLLPLEEHGNC